MERLPKRRGHFVVSKDLASDSLSHCQPRLKASICDEEIPSDAVVELVDHVTELMDVAAAGVPLSEVRLKRRKRGTQLPLVCQTGKPPELLALSLAERIGSSHGAGVAA